VINFVQTSADRVHGYHGTYAAYAGLLRTPHSGHRVEKAIALGMPWAMDNGCFKRYEPKAIISMMRRFQGLQGCKFMVVPDVVGNHEETLILFRAWLGTIQRYGYPVAFVVQNGATVESIPWGSIQAIFIGGDTAFKYSEVVRAIVKEAKRRGIWVHMGRVNTLERIRYALSIGCDSIDGTSTCIAPEINIKRQAPHYAADRQMNLWELELVA
jgi:hypothetical protein